MLMSKKHFLSILPGFTVGIYNNLDFSKGEIFDESQALSPMINAVFRVHFTNRSYEYVIPEAPFEMPRFPADDACRASVSVLSGCYRRRL